VIPLYYARGELGYSPEWIRMSKRSMMSLMPQFNSHRMVGEYVRRFYLPAANQGKRVAADGFAAARDLAAWKERVRTAWPSAQIRAVETPRGSIKFGESTRFVVAAKLAGLETRDLLVELLIAPAAPELAAESSQSQVFHADGAVDGDARFVLDLAPELSGKLQYRIRAYPYHPALRHRFEMGLMKWL
jgi:starch phosphorylase